MVNDGRVGFSLCNVAVATHTREAAVRRLGVGILELPCSDMIHNKFYHTIFFAVAPSISHSPKK